MHTPTWSERGLQGGRASISHRQQKASKAVPEMPTVCRCFQHHMTGVPAIAWVCNGTECAESKKRHCRTQTTSDEPGLRGGEQSWGAIGREWAIGTRRPEILFRCLVGARRAHDSQIYPHNFPYQLVNAVPPSRQPGAHSCSLPAANGSLPPSQLLPCEPGRRSGCYLSVPVLILIIFEEEQHYHYRKNQWSMHLGA